MNPKIKWTLIVSIIIIGIAFLYIMLIGSGSSEIEGCIINEECSLSLCDCECHLKGQTPEELDGIVCGKDCAEWFNVSGCACEMGQCKVIIE